MRQQQVDEELRASIISTSTITPGSNLADRSVDQGNTSEVSDTGLGDGWNEESTLLPPLELSLSLSSTSPPVPAKKKKRYSLAPPRLSLGQDAFRDIGSWGDSLFDSISTPTTTTASDASDASTRSGLVKKSAPVIGGTGAEKTDTNLSAGVAGSNVTSTSLTAKGKEKERGEDEKKELSGPHGLTTPSSSLISTPLTARSLPTQTPNQRSQPSLSQSQIQSQTLAQPQLQSGPTPPPKTAPVVLQPPILSTSTSSSSSTSTTSSNSQPKAQVQPSMITTKAIDRFTPSPTPSLARGRTGNDPPKSADSPLPKITSTGTLPKSQPKPPRERSSSRASTAHRPLPPQKPLPTLSLMSPIPLPNPPSHVELKSKISTVSLRTAAKRDKEREKEAEKIGKVDGVEKKEQGAVKKEEKAKAKEETGEEGWPMTAKERIELMASINHDNDGLDFGGRKQIQDTPAPPDLNKKTSSASLDPRHSYDVRDSHLSVDSAKFDPNRLSSTSAGSRGSTRSISGSGLKLIIEGTDYHNDNRDSNVSTSTITNATIVSGPVAVATRARADLVVSPVTPSTLATLSSIGSPSPADLGVLSPGELLLGAGAGSRETTPKQITPSTISNVDVVTDDERPRVRVEGRSPSPGSSTHSHSSSSATTLSSTCLSSLSSANKAAGYTRPAIEQDSSWEGEEEARRPVASSSSSSPLASPYQSEFDDDDDEIEVGDEEEEAVVTRIDSPPGSREGSTASLTDDITGHRRPSLVIPSLSSYLPMAHRPPTNVAAVSQMLSPLNGTPHSGGSSPGQRYPGWVSDVLSKVGLEVFVDEKVEPRDYFEGLTEVAEGESGFVYQAKVVRTVPESRLTRRVPQPGAVVAIKAVPILPSGSTKLEDLMREVEAMKKVFEDDRSAAESPFSSASGSSARAGHVLIMEAMYVDLQEDALWIRMELMERSLADVVALVEDGHLERMDEKVVARFASDVSARACFILFYLVGGLIVSCPPLFFV